VTGLDSRVLLEPDDGSTGPLLRVADDRLAPGTGYGRHLHRAVDVVAVVLAGSLRHAWGTEPVVAAGDVAVLRAGTGLEHDEVAGDDGTHLLQTYLPLLTYLLLTRLLPTYLLLRCLSPICLLLRCLLLRCLLLRWPLLMWPQRWRSPRRRRSQRGGGTH